MPIYVYETTGRKKRQFEIKQSMNDAPLTVHPETGEPVVRVISGGYGILEKGKAKSAAKPARRHGGGGGCCGGHCGCGH